MMGWSREYSVEVLSRFRSPSGRSDLGGCGRREGMTRLRQGGRLKNKNIWFYGDTALVGVMGHKFKTLIALVSYPALPAARAECTAGTVWQHGNTREDPKKSTF